MQIPIALNKIQIFNNLFSGLIPVLILSTLWQAPTLAMAGTETQTNWFAEKIFTLISNNNSDKCQKLFAQIPPIAKQYFLDNIELSGLTPLHFAVFLGHTQTVEVLLAAGANHMLKDSNNVTPIEIACMRLSQYQLKAKKNNLSESELRAITTYSHLVQVLKNFDDLWVSC